MIDIEIMKDNLINDVEGKILTADQRITHKAKLELIEKFEEITIFNELKKIIREDTKISLRKASIICAEELLLTSIYVSRNHYKIDDIFNNSFKKFKISNRDKKKLKSLEDFHPKDPNLSAEIANFNISYYKRIINNIVLEDWWLVDEEQVKESFKNIHNEIKFC